MQDPFGVESKKKVSKAFTLNRKEAKKDALNVGATGAATGAGLGAITAQKPMYKLKSGSLKPASKFPKKAAGKGALAIGAIGAASGAAANVGWKKKKK